MFLICFKTNSSGVDMNFHIEYFLLLNSSELKNVVWNLLCFLSHKLPCNQSRCRVTFKLFWGMKNLFSQEKQTFKYLILVIKDELRDKIIDYGGTLIKITRLSQVHELLIRVGVGDKLNFGLLSLLRLHLHVTLLRHQSLNSIWSSYKAIEPLQKIWTEPLHID